MKRLFFRIYLFFFGRAFFYRFNKAMVVTGLKGLGVLNYQSFRESGEKHTLFLISKYYTIKTIFDIGANLGNYSLECRRWFPEADIYVFEPHPVTCEKLVKNTAGSNMKVFNLGFSDQASHMNLYDYAGSGGSSHASLYQGYFTDLSQKETTSTRVLIETLDGFMNDQDIGQIDFLKIDTEGNEFLILKGAEKSIQNGKIRIIQFEFGPPDVISRIFFKDFFDMLNPLYDIYRILPYSLLPVKQYFPLHHEVFAFQNFLAVLRSDNRLP